MVGPRRELIPRMVGALGRTAWRVPRVVWLLVLGAAFVRSIAMSVFEGPDLISASESGLTAANWITGQGYTFDFYGYRAESPLQSFMPPLFTIFVAGCLLSPWPESLFGAVQVLLSTLTVMLVYLIAARLADPVVGVVAAALTAVYPPFLILVDQPTVPVLNTFLLGLWLYLSIMLVETLDLKWAVAVGVVLGLSVLSRPTFLGLLVVLVCALWWARQNRGDRWWQAAVIVLGITILIPAPWLIRNHWIHGRPMFVSTNGGFSFWNGNNPFTTGSSFDVVIPKLEAYSGEAMAAPGGTAVPKGADVVEVKPYPLPLELRDRVETMDEVALDQALYRSAFAFIRDQPDDWLALLGQKLVSLWWFRPNIGRSSGFYEENWILPYKLLYTAVLIPALVGLGLSLGRWRQYVLLYGTFLFLTIAYAAYNVITRYRWEMEPFLLILASLALVTAGRWLMEHGAWTRQA